MMQTEQRDFVAKAHVECTRRMGCAPETTLIDTAHLTATLSPFDSDAINIIARSEGESPEHSILLEDLVRRNLSFMWLLDPEMRCSSRIGQHLKTRGVKWGGRVPLMIHRLQGILKNEDRGTDLVPVDSNESADTWARVFAESYDLGKQEERRYFERWVHGELKTPRPAFLNFFLNHKGQAVGVGTLLRHEDGGILVNLGVPPSQRGHGHGTQLTKLLLEEAKRVGLSRIGLSATNDGLRIYRALGFDMVGLSDAWFFTSHTEKT